MKHHGSFLSGSGNRRAVELHLAGVGFDEPEEYIEKGAFAAARRPDDADEFAFADFESEVFERGDRLAVLRCKNESDISRLNERNHRPPGEFV